MKHMKSTDPVLEMTQDLSDLTNIFATEANNASAIYAQKIANDVAMYAQKKKNKAMRNKLGFK